MFPQKSLVFPLLLCLALMTPSAVAAAQEGRSWDFSAAGKEWSSSSTLPIDGKTALGPFNQRNDAVSDGATLTLAGLPTGNWTLSFDLYLIGSWDSANSDKADTFDVTDGTGRVLLHMTEFPCRIEGNDEGKPIGNKGLVKTPLSDRALGFWVVPVRLPVAPNSFSDGKLVLSFSGKPTARRVESWAIGSVRLDPR